MNEQEPVVRPKYDVQIEWLIQQAADTRKALAELVTVVKDLSGEMERLRYELHTRK